MTRFASLQLPAQPTVLAPDGSEVRVLVATMAGSMAHFHLPAGAVAKAVTHRSVDELWFIVAGAGQMWRLQDGHEEVVALVPGLSLSLPQGTHFQFRAAPDQAVSAVAVTMPPWPGPDEAVVVVDGPWRSTA